MSTPSKASPVRPYPASRPCSDLANWLQELRAEAEATQSIIARGFALDAARCAAAAIIANGCTA